MKIKILLPLAIFFCVAITANAQINEGRYLLGGSVSFSHYLTNNVAPAPDYKSNSINLGIQLGKFINSNTVIGGIANYNYSKQSSETKANGFGVGIFYRKYKSLGNNFYLFGEGNIQYAYTKSTNTLGPNIISKVNSVYLSLLPGLSYSITHKFQMELTLPGLFSVSYANTTNSLNSGSQSSFSIGGNLNQNLLSNVGIGFKLIL